MQFDMEGDIKPKLQALCKEFPIAWEYPIKADDFMSAARRSVTLLAPTRSKSGSIAASDCARAWEFAASNVSFGASASNVVRTAAALCTVPLSQSSCERLNSIIKLVHGDRRQLLNSHTAANEIAIRTTTMLEE